MFFKSITLAALAATASVGAQQISGADMVSNINRLTTLTRIATAVTQYVVYVDNPLVNRNDTIVAIDAIGTQGILDQDLLTGQACGSLTKRYSGSIAGRAMLGKRADSTYTAEEQSNVADAYTTLASVSKEFMDACVDKHDAVVAHDAAHQMGEALANTQAILDTVTNTMMGTVPAQADVMTAQKNLLDQTYSSTVDLYVNGPS